MTGLFLALALALPRGAGAAPLLSLDFSSMPSGTLSDDALQSTACRAPWTTGLKEGRGEIVDAGQGRALRVRYLAGKIGPEASVQFYCPLEPRDSAYLRYRVKLGDDKGFEFVRGGKLPGLCGGKCNSGGKRPTGDGWSSRFVWKGGGRLILYVYHLDQKGKYGDTFDVGRLASGEWHELAERVTMNAPDKADGRVEAWIDGQPALTKDGLRFRDRSGVAVDRFYFSTFYGGDDATWAPPKDQFVYFPGFDVTD